MRIGILHPGPFRGGAPAVTAGQVRKKQCGKAGRSPARAGSHPGLGHVLAASPRAAAGTKGRVAVRPPRQPLAAPPCDARGGGAPHPAGSCGRVPLPCATACATPAGPLEVSSSWVRDTRVQIRPGTRETERGELRPAPSTLPGAGALRSMGTGGPRAEAAVRAATASLSPGGHLLSAPLRRTAGVVIARMTPGAPRLPRHPVTRAQDACGRHRHATCSVAPAVTLTARCACPFGSRGPRSGPRARAWLPSLSGA